MNNPLPEHLVSTGLLIKKAFPTGMAEMEYLAVLKVLYPHMSDRNLAKVISSLSGNSEAKVSNDIAKTARMSEVEFQSLPFVLQQLKRAGFDNWVEEA